MVLFAFSNEGCELRQVFIKWHLAISKSLSSQYPKVASRVKNILEPLIFKKMVSSHGKMNFGLFMAFFSKSTQIRTLLLRFMCRVIMVSTRRFLFLPAQLLPVPVFSWSHFPLSELKDVWCDTRCVVRRQIAWMCVVIQNYFDRFAFHEFQSIENIRCRVIVQIQIPACSSAQQVVKLYKFSLKCSHIHQVVPVLYQNIHIVQSFCSHCSSSCLMEEILVLCTFVCIVSQK